MSQHYTTGEVANRMGVSKTTLINYINDFNLAIHKDPANNYREFSHEDVQMIDQLHASITRVGRERALREWHGPTTAPQGTGKDLHERTDNPLYQ